MKYDPYEVQLAREMLYSVLSRCPLEGSDDDCQLCELRERSLHERQQWLLDLDDHDVMQLAIKHRECVEAQVHAAEGV